MHVCIYIGRLKESGSDPKARILQPFEDSSDESIDWNSFIGSNLTKYRRTDKKISKPIAGLVSCLNIKYIVRYKTHLNKQTNKRIRIIRRKLHFN